ncbi:protein kinase domain-containing protein [Desmospora activa]|uniref:Serine/threonine-protein kinase PrkC n=1 Tax=Desmospora activa DSM 45169 TaxID=1121389 RepID=A0A2T4Z6R5_9BACL|nr:protein kinase [Desmospora activa]PTM57583.1 serine/threonine protein kinase [Desmospora activa DSM 45169]
MEGKLLGQRYEILRQLGGGGMAVVYLAQDRLLERQVAIKVLDDELGHDTDFIRRFEREAQAAASLSHPHIIAIYDVGQEDEIYYIVMEYMEGASLMDRIAERGMIPAREAVEIAIQICDGLEHAHQQGIIHRDIKPHNMMATATGQFKLGDFGIAQRHGATALTQSGQVMGSVHYFSPEQAQGKTVGPQSDVYSLGVVLYEMVTGTPPFNSEEGIAIALSHLRDPIPDPRRWNLDLPDGVCHVIARAMEKSSDTRYQSTAEMKAELEQAFLDIPRQPVQAFAPVSAVSEEGGMVANAASGKGKGWREWLHKRRLWFGLGIGLPLVLVSFFILWVGGELVQTQGGENGPQQPREVAGVAEKEEQTDGQEQEVTAEAETGEQQQPSDQTEKNQSAADEKKENDSPPSSTTPPSQQQPEERVVPQFEEFFDEATWTVRAKATQPGEGYFRIWVFKDDTPEYYQHYQSEEKYWDTFSFTIPDWESFPPGTYKISPHFHQSELDALPVDSDREFTVVKD